MYYYLDHLLGYERGRIGVGIGTVPWIMASVCLCSDDKLLLTALDGKGIQRALSLSCRQTSSPQRASDSTNKSTTKSSRHLQFYFQFDQSFKGDFEFDERNFVYRKRFFVLSSPFQLPTFNSMNRCFGSRTTNFPMGPRSRILGAESSNKPNSKCETVKI